MMPKSTAVSRAGGGDEQVALVQVGVEDAVVQRLGQEGADQVVGQRVAVEARLRRARRDRTAATPRAHSRVSTRLPTPVPDHLGRAHVAVRGHDLARSSSAPAASKRRSSSSSSDARRRSRRRRAAPAAAPAATSVVGQARGQRAAPRRRAATRARCRAAAPSPPPRARRAGVAAVGLGQGGGGDRLAEARRTARSSGRPSARFDLGPGHGRAGRAAAGPSAGRGPRRTARRRCRRGWTGTGRA